MMNPPPRPALQRDTTASTGFESNGTTTTATTTTDDKQPLPLASFSPSSGASTPATVLTTTSASPEPPKTPRSQDGSRINTTAHANTTAHGTHTRSRPHRHSTSSFDAIPDSRVLFGHGTINRLPAELGRLRLSSPLIVSSPSRIALARRVQALIPNLTSRILDSAVVNVPAKVVDDAVARISGHDVVISIGAGQAIGLAKAISIRKVIPHFCIPTTYSGSEMSPLLAADGRKLGHRAANVVPTVILYDEDLTGSVAPKRFAAPNFEAACSATKADLSERRSSTGDDAQWSYIHLPGV